MIYKSTTFTPFTPPVSKKFWRYSFLQGKVIVIEGVISAGKSSLGKEMARFINEECGIPSVYLPEYVDIELLKQFIGDMKTYAYSFQLFMLEKRAEIYRNALEYAKLGYVVFVDRSMHGDLVFAMHHYNIGNITEKQFENYRTKMTNFKFNEPSLIIYLDVSAECAARRALKRNREGETYDLGYFKAIMNTYEEVFKNYNGSFMHIDYEQDLLVEEMTPKAIEILEKTIKFLFDV